MSGDDGHDLPEGPAAADQGVDEGAAEPVGSVAEEAAKLLGALAGLTGGSEPGAAGGLGGLAAHAAAAAREAQEHLAQARRSAAADLDQDHHTGHDTGHDTAHDGEGPECRLCPVCRAARAVRQTSPEVRAHLADAGSSLLQAAAGWLATAVPDDARPRRDGVERIDLDRGPMDEADDQDRAERRAADEAEWLEDR